LKVLVAERLAP